MAKGLAFVRTSKSGISVLVSARPNFNFVKAKWKKNCDKQSFCCESSQGQLLWFNFEKQN